MIEQRENIRSVAKVSAHRALLLRAVCAFVLAGALGLIAQASHSLVVAAANADTKTERVLVAIEGMHCDGCATGIRAMLKRTEGVMSADVSYERKEAVVEFDSGRTTREKIVQVIVNLGYKASVKG